MQVASGAGRYVPGTPTTLSDPITPPPSPTTPAEMFHSSTLNGPDGWMYTWMDYTFPYVKSLQVYLCPSKSFPWVNSAGNKKYWPVYSYNGAISGGGSVPNNPVKMAAVVNASEKIMLFHHRHQAYGYTYPSDVYSPLTALLAGSYNGDNEARARNITIHLNGQTMLFADGHAKWASAEKLRDVYLCGGNNISATYDQAPVTTSGCGYWYPKSPVS